MVTKSHPVVYYQRAINRRGYTDAPSTVATYILNNSSYTIQNSVTSDKVPNFKYLIANHLNATSDRSGYRWSESATPSTGSANFEEFQGALNPIWRPYVSESEGEIVSWQLINTSPYFGTFSSSNRNKALAKFYKKAIAAQRKFSGGVFLGELRQTIQLVKNPARAIREGIGPYLSSLRTRTRGVNSRSRLRRIVADSYLEWIFGVVPLYRDFIDAAKALNQLADGGLKEYIYISAQHTSDPDVGDAEDKSFRVSFGPYLTFYPHWYWGTKLSSRYIGQVKAEAYGPAFAARTLGFHFNDFVPTLWEVLPWSFLIDYFTNVGDVLESWSFASSNIAWMQLTDKWETFGKAKWTLEEDASIELALNTHPFRNGSVTGTGGSKEVRSTGFNRYRLETIPLPHLGWELPGVGSRKWTNIAALIAARDRSRSLFIR